MATTGKIQTNEVLDKLPKHLMDLVIDQPYLDYTAQNQATWRYVMRQNINFLGKVAHKSYLKGLKVTGISIDSIPHMYGMNRILSKIGWAAVSVDGFIPPQAFMEFQAYNILVIAADIRNIEHIEYTPAPDIIHEAAGHAPIIADPKYSEYLRLFGKYGAKAFSSKKDYELYEAIRHLSIIKENPNTKQPVIDEAEAHIADLQNNMGEPSEMAQIRNLHWWTVEYGLIGELDNPRIYGAGLLSSISESYNCLKPKVKKLPYTIDAVNYSFDITTEQPQLFVTPSFKHLTDVLEEFTERLAFKRGGCYGLKIASESSNYATIEMSSGLQISGKLKQYLEKDEKPIYFNTEGFTALSLNNKQLKGHSKQAHKDGFGSPIGKLKNNPIAIENMNDSELKEVNINVNSGCELEFESGVKVKGTVSQITRSQEGKVIIIQFTQCTASYNNQILFNPDWGVYDMAVGESIPSVYAGLADSTSFGLSYEAPKEKTGKLNYTQSQKDLHALYQQVRDIRDSNSHYDTLPTIFNTLSSKHKKDWLLALEILEIISHIGIYDTLQNEIETYLKNFIKLYPEEKKLIIDGLNLVKSQFELNHNE